MKKIFLFIFVLFFQIKIFSTGKSGADILNVMYGGRALGFCGAYSAVGDDIEVLSYNPAGISLITKKEFQYMFINSYINMNIHSFSYAQPFESPIIEGIFGISGVYRTIPDIINEDASDAPVKYYDMAAMITYANNLYYFIKEENLKNLYSGFNLKFIMEKIREYEISIFAFDFGFKYFIDNKIKMAIALQNLGIPYKFVAEESPLPITLRLGLSFENELDKDNKLIIGLDYIQNFYDNGRILFGIEDNIVDIVFIRSGVDFSLNRETPLSFALGAGLAITQFDITVMLNYVWKPILWIGFSDFTSNHILSMQIKF